VSAGVTWRAEDPPGGRNPGRWDPEVEDLMLHPGEWRLAIENEGRYSVQRHLGALRDACRRAGVPVEVRTVLTEDGTYNGYIRRREA